MPAILESVSRFLTNRPEQSTSEAENARYIALLAKAADGKSLSAKEQAERDALMTALDITDESAQAEVQAAARLIGLTAKLAATNAGLPELEAASRKANDGLDKRIAAMRREAASAASAANVAVHTLAGTNREMNEVTAKHPRLRGLIAKR